MRHSTFIHINLTNYVHGSIVRTHGRENNPDLPQAQSRIITQKAPSACNSTSPKEVCSLSSVHLLWGRYVHCSPLDVVLRRQHSICELDWLEMRLLGRLNRAGTALLTADTDDGSELIAVNARDSYWT